MPESIGCYVASSEAAFISTSLSWPAGFGTSGATSAALSDLPGDGELWLGAGLQKRLQRWGTIRRPKVTPSKNGKVIGFDHLFIEKGPIQQNNRNIFEKMDLKGACHVLQIH